MANKSRFIIAESSIKSYFKQAQKKVYKAEELNGIFEQKKGTWHLPEYMWASKFIERLLEKEILILKEIKFEGATSDKIRYCTGDENIFELATSLINKSYLSHFTAIFLHGLTTQIPKTVYLTFEQSLKQNINRGLKQDAIDAAFTKPQRKTGSKAIYNEYTILVHNSMFTNRTGITYINDLPVTNIERTLIDITVRPGYAGGVHSVLETYKNVIDKISINKLIAYLNTINYIYPYHQAIGFYLERAGLDPKKLEDLRRKRIQFNFYLTYEMTEMEYSKDWKIYYPKGLL